MIPPILKASILLADDEVQTRKLIASQIAHLRPDWEIMAAKDGMQCLEIARKEIPDLILLDWVMPESDGLQTLLRIRQEPATKDIPVIMFSGVMVSPENLATALSQGADGFIRKEVNPIELIAMMESCLSRRRQQLEYQRIQEELYTVQREAMANELKLKSSEIASLVMLIERKNGQLARVREKILESEVQSRQLVEEIDGYLESQEEWEMLRTRINSAQAGFLTRLSVRHHDLTQGEMKFCSLLKANLDAEEIADILHISIRGVEQKRHRIRKKLGLERDDSLESYLLGI